MFEIFIGIGAGISAGISYALLGWKKNKGQAFDAKKFVTTIIIGAGAGATMHLSGIQTEVAYNYLLSLGAVPIVENVVKMIWRRILGKENPSTRR